MAEWPWSAPDRAYLVSRHADVVACLKADALSSVITPATLSDSPADIAAPYLAILHRQIDLMDGPAHGALRNHLSCIVSRSRLDDLRRFSAGWMSDRLRTLPRTIDVMADIAHPLARAVVTRAIGFQAKDEEALLRAMSVFTSALDRPAALGDPAAAAIDDLRRLITVARDRADLDEHSLLAMTPDGGPHGLPLDVLLPNVLLLLAAGHPTTAHAIGNGAWLLLTYPSALVTLRRQPEVWTTAIDEILRMESPVQRVRRRATRSSVVAGQSVSEGSELVLLLGAANRDRDAFKDPESFDVMRERNYQVAFGHGVHLCLGAPLARMTMRVALETLFETETIRLVDPSPAWIISPAHRGLRHLLVERA